MIKVKGQTNFILALVFALIVAIFAVFNVDAVEVNYLFGTGQAPLILIILGSVLMGGIITGTFGMVRIYRLQRQKRSLEQRLQQYESTSPMEHEDNNQDSSPLEENSRKDDPVKHS